LNPDYFLLQKVKISSRLLELDCREGVFLCCPTNVVLVVLSEGPALKRKPTPPKDVRRPSEEEKAETEAEEQELVTVTKVVEEVGICVVLISSQSHFISNMGFCA